MKIAFDEHIPPVLVKVFKTLASDGDVLSAEFVSARDYGIPKALSDIPWIEKYAKDGGRVIISGDKAMRGNLHEQAALYGAEMIVVFFHPHWNHFDPFVKSAMLLKYWPVVEAKIKVAKPGQFFEMPFTWQASELKEVTPPKKLPRKLRRKKHQKKLEIAHESKEARSAAAKS